MNRMSNMRKYNLKLAQSAGVINTPNASLQRGKNVCPRYATKQSDGWASVILELWGMWSPPLFPSLQPRVLVPDSALSMG